MSLKRILGTALATRMGGRGRRRGLMGSSAMLGGYGRRRRSSLHGKAGLAALGYMAYKAYQEHQSKSGGGSTGGTATTTSNASSSSSGGLGDMVQDLTNKVSSMMSGQDTSSTSREEPTEEELREDEQAANDFSEEKALLLIRGMVTAAYADGSMSVEERQRIMREIEEGDSDPEDRAIMEREIASPKPLEELLTQVNDEETAEEFYVASRAAVDGETEANKGYLADLRQRLNLTEEQAAEAEEIAA